MKTQLRTHFLAKFDPAIAALNRVIGSSRVKDVLAEERDAYAEIGRIVGLPFSASKVYERFAEQVARLIPLDLIVITNLNRKHDSYTIMYSLGKDLAGSAQGDTIPLSGSVIADVAISAHPIRTDLRGDSTRAAQSLDNAGLVSRIATPLIANCQAVGTLHLASCTPDGYGELELTRLEIVGSQISGAIASTLLLQPELKRVRHWRTLFSC